MVLGLLPVRDNVMNSAVLKKIYEKSPQGIKKISGYLLRSIPPGVLYGRTFRRWHQFLEKSQWWGREKIEEYQIKQLYEIIEYAYKNVPYYKNVLDERGILPPDIRTFDD